eukprot:5501228-Amphidinium_carterae.1
MQEIQRRTTEASLEPAEITKYRSRVMRAYPSLHHPDLAHAVKCLSRHMQAPTQTWNQHGRLEVCWSVLAQSQVLGKCLQETELARQSAGSRRHRLCGQPDFKEEHHRSCYFLRCALHQNPEQLTLSYNPQSAYHREKLNTMGLSKQWQWGS